MQKITISGPITAETFDQVKAQTDRLDSALPLTIELNSDGGAVDAGIAIYNHLSAWPGGCKTEVVGWALSIASLILMAGQERAVHQNSLVMVHAPWTTSTGNAIELRDRAALLDRVAVTMQSAYQATGQRAATVKQWLDGTDHWFSADEALAAGLATRIIESPNRAAPANASACLHKIPSLYAKIMIQDTTIEAAADQNRRAEITARFGKFAKQEPALMASCLADRACSADEASTRLLTQIGREVEPLNPIGSYARVSTGVDRVAEFKAAARDVLLARSGIKLDEVHPGARDLQRMSISAMAESVLSMTGHRRLDMSSAGAISAALGTSDFVQLLSNVSNKSLTIGYAEAPAGHAVFTAEREVPDFKTNTLVSLSEAPALEKVHELGEYVHGSLNDSATTFELATFGKILRISRQALINDDLTAFTSLPRSMGAAARRLEADMTFSILTSNPTLSDGNALFSAAHANQGSALALTVAGLASARSAMRLQKGVAGLQYLDPQPRYLVVPVALETAAEQLLASLVDPSKSNATPNSEFIRGLTLVADPRLDGNSTTAWYLSADPRQIEGVLRAYLSGQPRPYLEENTEFAVDAVSFKVRLDFAAGVIDYRGLYRSVSS
ncbi:MAG: Clp protease ClpP [Comamonadaceae bacterium]|nr:Clp protease ClpP [Comamonadaceae bacterium]